MKRSTVLGLHALPPRWLALGLASLPFILVFVAYLYFSNARHEENPRDKLLPTISQMGETFKRYAFEENKRTGEVLFWRDTGSSLKRLAIGMSISTILALFIGLNMGMFRGLSATTAPFLTFISMIPPISILPILFIALSIGELGKVALIFLGAFPLMTRDIYMSVKRLPPQQVTKALTLGASTWAVVYHVTLLSLRPGVSYHGTAGQP